MNSNNIFLFYDNNTIDERRQPENLQSHGIIENSHQVLGCILCISKSLDNDLSDPDIIMEFVTNFLFFFASFITYCLSLGLMLQ